MILDSRFELAHTSGLLFALRRPYVGYLALIDSLGGIAFFNILAPFRNKSCHAWRLQPGDYYSVNLTIIYYVSYMIGLSTRFYSSCASVYQMSLLSSGVCGGYRVIGY